MVVVETADPDINIEFDPEERDPEGKWIIVKKPGKIQTNEGDDVSITIEVAKEGFILDGYKIALSR